MLIIRLMLFGHVHTNTIACRCVSDPLQTSVLNNNKHLRVQYSILAGLHLEGTKRTLIPLNTISALTQDKAGNKIHQSSNIKPSLQTTTKQYYLSGYR